MEDVTQPTSLAHERNCIFNPQHKIVHDLKQQWSVSFSTYCIVDKNQVLFSKRATLSFSQGTCTSGCSVPGHARSSGGTRAAHTTGSNLSSLPPLSTTGCTRPSLMKVWFFIKLFLIILDGNGCKNNQALWTSDENI